MDARVLRFLAIAFGISWSIAALGMAFGVRSATAPGYTVVAGAAMFGPALAALLCAHRFDRTGWSALGVGLRPFRVKPFLATALIGVAIVPVILAGTALLAARFPEAGFGRVVFTSDGLVDQVKVLAAELGAPPMEEEKLGPLRSFPPGLILLGALVGAVVAACTVNLPFMLGEELGWRGYLWGRIAHWPGARRIGFAGVVWGLWHAPLIAIGHNYPGHPVAGVGMMVLLCLALALLFDHVRWRSGHVWTSALLHGIINGSAGSYALFAAQGHPLLGSIAGLAGILGLVLIGGFVVLVDGPYRRSLFARVA
ncbi:MAG: CPBP family intramembrane metalloprotease [Flavobacteriales bacterium]|nr:CPBP family intramembrane metalloprotease [Flavobacteriales bacterium]